MSSLLIEGDTNRRAPVASVRDVQATSCIHFVARSLPFSPSSTSDPSSSHSPATILKRSGLSYAAAVNLRWLIDRHHTLDTCLPPRTNQTDIECHGIASRQFVCAFWLNLQLPAPCKDRPFTYPAPAEHW